MKEKVINKLFKWLRDNAFGCSYLILVCLFSMIEFAFLMHYKAHTMLFWVIALYLPFISLGFIFFFIKLLLRWSGRTKASDENDKRSLFQRAHTLSIFAAIASAISLMISLLLIITYDKITYAFDYNAFNDTFPFWTLLLIWLGLVLLWLACAFLLKKSSTIKNDAIKVLIFCGVGLILFLSIIAPYICAHIINEKTRRVDYSNGYSITYDGSYSTPYYSSGEIASDDIAVVDESYIEDDEGNRRYSDPYVESIAHDIVSYIKDTTGTWRSSDRYYVSLDNSDSCRYFIDINNEFYYYYESRGKYILRHDELLVESEENENSNVNLQTLEKYAKLANIWESIKYDSEEDLESIISRMRPILKSQIGQKTYLRSGLYLYVDILDYAYQDLMYQYEHGNTTIYNELYDLMMYNQKYERGVPSYSEISRFCTYNEHGDQNFVWAYSFWARRYNESGDYRLRVLRKYLDEILESYPNKSYIFTPENE